MTATATATVVPVGLVEVCTATSYYSCSGATVGFSWTDTTAPGATVVAATISFAPGVACSSPSRDVSLNGVPVASYNASVWCTCDVPVSLPYVALTLPPAHIAEGGTNTLSVTNYGGCAGFFSSFDLGNGFALVNTTTSIALGSCSATASGTPTASNAPL